MRGIPPILLVHGGAGAWHAHRNRIEEVSRVLRDALKSGHELFRSASAIEAAVEAVRILEDSGILNAGLGSVVDMGGDNHGCGSYGWVQWES